MSWNISMESICEEIFHKLLIVIPDLLTIRGSGNSTPKGKPKLNFEILRRWPGMLKISLSHCNEYSDGDNIRHPDMTLAVYLERRIAEVVEFQNSRKMVFVYSLDGGSVDIKAKRRLNLMFDSWLNNLIRNGYEINSAPSHDQNRDDIKT